MSALTWGKPIRVLATISILACAPDRGSDIWTGTVDTLATGTVAVSNAGSPITSQLDRWTVEETERIGELEGDGPYVFGRIRAIEVDASDRILVFDDLANELRVFSRSGAQVETRGRRGAGPGEFRAVIGMSLSPEGDLWIVDAENGRYTIVSPEGDVHSVRRPVAMFTLPWLGGFADSGRFFDQGTDEVNGRLVDALLEIGPDGEVRNRFPLPRVELPVPRMGTMEFPLPFAPRIRRSFDPAGAVWQAVSSEYRITRIELGGDTALIVSRDIVPQPLRGRERDSVAVYARALEARFGLSVPRGTLPDRVSPVRWFTVDDKGNLWVCATGLDPCDELDVFDPSGRFLSAVGLPTPVRDTPRPIIRRDRFLAAVEGALGEPQLLLGRVVRR